MNKLTLRAQRLVQSLRRRMVDDLFKGACYLLLLVSFLIGLNKYEEHKKFEGSLIRQIEKSLHPFGNKFEVTYVAKDREMLLLKNKQNPRALFFLAERKNSDTKPEHDKDLEIKWLMGRGYVPLGDYSQSHMEYNQNFSYSTMFVDAHNTHAIVVYDLNTVRLIQVIALPLIEKYESKAREDFNELRSYLSARF
ncbi:MAG: hypothetical protein R3A80_07655 [Bdellovibrionota bacterium]